LTAQPDVAMRISIGSDPRVGRALFATAIVLLMAFGACTPPSSYEHLISAGGPDKPLETSKVTTESAVTAVATALPTQTAAPELTPAQRCALAPECAKQGACSFADGQCMAVSTADCRKVAACAAGRCSITKGICAPAVLCHKSFGCKEEGLCGDGADAKCRPRSPVDCRRSDACAAAARCSLVGEACAIKGDRDCRRSTVCTRDGRCVFKGGQCVADSDESCAQASVCKDKGQCLALSGYCIKSCKDSEPCRQSGRCALKKGVDGGQNSCIATKEADCERAVSCAVAGACSLVSGNCRAGDDIDCRKSRSCKEQGRCSARRGRCVPASTPECRNATIACGKEKRCRFENGLCVR